MLFEKPYVTQGALNSSGLAFDGHFLMLRAGQQEQEASQINVVLNWTEELKCEGNYMEILFPCLERCRESSPFMKRCP
jgi:hypothetical protein